MEDIVKREEKIFGVRKGLSKTDQPLELFVHKRSQYRDIDKTPQPNPDAYIHQLGSLGSSDTQVRDTDKRSKSTT